MADFGPQKSGYVAVREWKHDTETGTVRLRQGCRAVPAAVDGPSGGPQGPEPGGTEASPVVVLDDDNAAVDPVSCVKRAQRQI